MFLGDAHAGVRNAKLDDGLPGRLGQGEFGPDADFRGAPVLVLGKLYGVSDEVEQDLPDADGIA